MGVKEVWVLSGDIYTVEKQKPHPLQVGLMRCCDYQSSVQESVVTIAAGAS
jgi:hypothetical protein